jgi:membrane-bound lytic murein transglycosylase A
MRIFPALFACAAVCTLVLSGCCVGPSKTAKAPPPVALQAASFELLPGWAADRPAEALAALSRSCERILKADPAKSFGPVAYAGSYGDWQAACRDMPAEGADDTAARQYFATKFVPYALSDGANRDGKFTGYYEPVLRGSLKRKKPYLIPLYARPDDLVTVNLGDFKPSLKGETIVGRVDDDHLVPYYTRAEIDKGAIKAEPKVVWVDDPVDAFFLHIQGSGEVVLPHHKIMQVGYAAANGRPYTAIGRALAKQGALDPKTVSMQTIRAWLQKHPKEARKVMEQDASFVFFRKLDADMGPLGAEGVELTPGRSLAVDRKLVPYGAPIWVDASSPQGKARLQRVMIAQDTGGAITGAVRGDYFWGAGKEAAESAGRMNSAGRDYIFLPKTVTVPPAYLEGAHPALPGFISLGFNGKLSAASQPVYNQ